MLHIGRLGRQRVSYYLRSVAETPAAYYLGDGEAPGEWIGQGAHALGLRGQVDGDQLRHLLAGLAADGQTRLVAPVLRRAPAARLRTGPLRDAVAETAAARGHAPERVCAAAGAAGAWRRVTSSTRVSVQDAERVAGAIGVDPAELYGARRWQAAQRARDRRVDARRDGFDLTFKPPKSVSLLWALGGPEVAQQVQAAHERAVTAALGYMERACAVARRGSGGHGLIDSDGFIAARFAHRTSRAGDPLLHTHVVLVNLLQAVDGRWSSLASSFLYAHAKTGGYLYQAALRHELTRTLGVAWQPLVNGWADIHGFDRPLIRVFSRRREDITRLLQVRGVHSARAAQAAVFATRPAKDEHATPALLAPEWQARAAQHGFTPARLAATLRRWPSSLPGGELVAQVAARLVGADGLTRHASTFTRRDVLQGWAAGLPAGAPVEEIERLADGFLAAEDLTVPLVDERGTRRWSTPQLLAVEEAILDAAARGRDGGVAVADPHVRDRTLAAAGWGPADQDQLAAVRRLTSSGDHVEALIGPAGVGKTSTLRVAAQIWARSGIPVIGTALSGVAVEGLEDHAGIRAWTLTALLGQLQDRHGGLPRGGVLIVDEAGMVGTRTYQQLLQAAEQAGAKLVLAGDHQQLPEIDAGGVLRGLVARLGANQLRTIRRQHPDNPDRQVLPLLRAGRVDGAVDVLRRHGRMVLGDTPQEVRWAMVTDFLAAGGGIGPERIMLAPLRADVDDLNARTQAARVAAGEVTGPMLEVAGQRFAVGDAVITCTPGWLNRHRVRNATRGVVVAVDPAAHTLMIRTGRGEELHVPRAFLEARRLALGYACTVHKAQGMTTERTFALGSDALYRELGYVAASRARAATTFYVVGLVDHDELDHEFPDDPKGLEDQGPLAHLVRALGRSRAQQLASDHTRDPKARRALRAASDTELRAQLADAAARVRAHPQDRPAVARWLEDEQARLAAEERQHLAAVHTTRQLLASLSRVAQRDQRHAATRQAQAHTRAAEAASTRRARLAAAQAKLASEQAATAAWAEEHTRVLAAGVRAAIELRSRRQARLRALERDPPRWLLSALGPQPANPAHRDTWRAAVAAVEAFRDRWGIIDPDRALGPDRPVLPAQQQQRCHLAVQLTQTHAMLTSPAQRSERVRRRLAG